MRDKLKDKCYFEKRILEIKEVMAGSMLRMNRGDICTERVNSVKQLYVWDYLRIISCKYSASYPIEELKDDLLNAINLTVESWVDNAWKIEYRNNYLNQYGLSAYDQMLWMLSLGYLLDIPNEEFQKLADVIDSDQVKDFLFEFIIRAKIKDRQPIEEESYQRFFGIQKTFSGLRKVIVETDKINTETLVKQYVRQEWYRNHKSEGWYNCHNSPHNIYFGYWSYETAAVVKIMDLDDSSFRDWKYYPKDLVHVNIK